MLAPRCCDANFVSGGGYGKLRRSFSMVQVPKNLVRGVKKGNHETPAGVDCIW